MEIDGYSNLTKLATGGMATVYKARQLSLNRTVAIKLLLAEFLWDDEAKSLFDQESLVIAQLNHPNIIHIIDRGLTDKGRPYFVMDYIQGSELSHVMQNEKPSINAKLNLLIQICKGMAAAHNNGVIHRDIKPSNILIDANEHVYILDFGIAWLAANGKPENIVGTPDYMSPEQFSAPESVDHHSDIYSLGIIMYEMFTGQLPPGHRNNLQSRLQNLSPALSSLILKCLQTNPAQRPASVDAIHLELLTLLKGGHLDQNEKSEAISAFNNPENKFELLDVIKRNPYGSVILFENKETKNLIVVKKRKGSFAGYQEAKLLTNLSHENIIKIYGTSKSKNTFIIVMEYLNGSSLQDRLARPYTLQKFLPIAKGICNALKFAHDNDITHGNLRPSNILINDKNNIKLTDFGLAEHYSDRTNRNDWYQPKDQGCTSRRRDIYSCGAIFYHMLTGELPPFKNKRIQSNTAFNALDKNIQTILRNMMEEDRSDRYQSFDQILPDIESISAINKAIRHINIELKDVLIISAALFIATGLIMFLLYYYDIL